MGILLRVTPPSTKLAISMLRHWRRGPSGYGLVYQFTSVQVVGGWTPLFTFSKVVVMEAVPLEASSSTTWETFTALQGKEGDGAWVRFTNCPRTDRLGQNRPSMIFRFTGVEGRVRLQG